MLVQAIKKLDLFMLFIKTNSHQAFSLGVFVCPEKPCTLVMVEVAQLHSVLIKMREGAKERGL